MLSTYDDKAWSVLLSVAHLQAFFSGGAGGGFPILVGVCLNQFFAETHSNSFGSRLDYLIKKSIVYGFFCSS